MWSLLTWLAWFKSGSLQPFYYFWGSLISDPLLLGPEPLLWGLIHHLHRVTLLCGDLVPDVCNWSLEGMCSKVIPRGADISSGINHWKQYLRASNQSEESGSVSKVDLKAHVVVFVCASVAAAGDHLPCCCLSPRNSLFSSPRNSYISLYRSCWVSLGPVSPPSSAT